MLVVVTKGVKKNFDVVLAAIAALEIRMLVCVCLSAISSNILLCLYTMSFYVLIA